MAKFRPQHTRETPVIPFDKCIAKTIENKNPGLSVEAHCTYVGAVAQELMKRLPLNIQNQIPQEAPALIALHDVGKVAPGFQKKILSRDELEKHAPGLAQMDDTSFTPYHANVSEAALLAWHQMRGGDKNDWEAWGKVLGIHHGKREVPKRDTSGSYGGTSWAQERRALLERLLKVFGDLPPKPPTAEQVTLLSGMTCVSDWMGSDTTFFPAEGLAEDVDPFSTATKVWTIG